MILKGGKIALPGREEFFEGDIRIEDGKIAEIGENLEGGEKVDCSGLMIFPGGIDAHTHFDDPGYTHREDFLSASSAAASGGITTIIDMPCTSVPPVTNLKNLRAKLEVVRRKSVVDFGFYGGVSAQSFEENFPQNVRELAPYVFGFKTYFISGMRTFARLDHWQFRQVLRETIKLGVPVLVHAEDFDYVNSATQFQKSRGDSPREYYLSRPEIAELLAVGAVADILRDVLTETGLPSGFKAVHIVHISCYRSVDKLMGLPITCETCPHYLEFNLDDFVRIGSPLKVTPPVKSGDNPQKLWRYLAVGKIDFVASDHAPAPYEEKYTGSVWTDYSGIPGVGTLFPYLLSEGFFRGRISLRRFVEITSAAPAKRYKIPNKGAIAPGYDADLVLVDPSLTWKVEGKKFFSRGKITPFEGYEFRGRIVKTLVRGKVVYDFRRGIVVPPGYGEFLTPCR